VPQGCSEGNMTLSTWIDFLAGIPTEKDREKVFTINSPRKSENFFQIKIYLVKIKESKKIKIN
jgi:hypothetical protein